MAAIETTNLRAVKFVMHPKTERRPDIALTGEDFQRLQNGAKLNDEVVNMYSNCLKPLVPPNVFILTSFFYARLIEKGYQAVSRWIKRLVCV
jgi:Ulp1 family protease